MLWKLTKVFFVLLLLGGIVGSAGIAYGLWYFNQDLPNHDALKNYRPPTVTRVHAGDGKVIAEYAEQRRVYVPIANIPQLIVNAFIATEDKNFYKHPGVDAIAVLRASVQNIKRLIDGGRPIGASTITQQVAKNFLLSNELSLTRKVKEALLALRIENALSKQQILDLYLNEIYMGRGAYGVAAAALTYFDKSLAEITVEEAAFLAALPKAPNNYNPWRQNARAKARRNWVIGQMREAGMISAEQASQAQQTPLTPIEQNPFEQVDARYFVEHVRRILAEQYGISEVNTGGLSVRTTLDTQLQLAAQNTLAQGVLAYDRRHGYRGVHYRFDDVQMQNWRTLLPEIPQPQKILEGWVLGVVTALSDTHAVVETLDQQVRIPLSAIKWAREFINERKRGPIVKSPADVLVVGDVIITSPLNAIDQADYAKSIEDNAVMTLDDSLPLYGLRQQPEIDGGIVAIDPFTGRVLAMQGGFDYRASEYNRVTQAKRQPGSAFKPFVYLAGLEEGFTPASLLLDAPFVLDQGPDKPKWKPANYSKEFYGMTPMRIGIEKSRNLMTVRLAQQIGMEKIAELTRRFALHDNLPQSLAVSLGSQEFTLLDITRGYAQIVNSGKKITPTAIDRVQDRLGNTLYLHDQRACVDCAFEDATALPILNDPSIRIANEALAYQVTSMLEGVVIRGTGRRIRSLEYPLAGKTGTSNDSVDTWFVGFSPNLAVGVYLGFDNPRSLGRHPAGYQETGSSVAAPVFRDFMAEALKHTNKIPFRVPNNIEFIKINPNNGQLAKRGDKWIEEAFLIGTSPNQAQQIDVETIVETLSTPQQELSNSASPTLNNSLPSIDTGSLTNGLY